MSQLHAIAGIVLAGLLAVYVLLTAWLWVVGRAPAWGEMTRLGLMGLLLAQGALGLVLYLGGARPSEGLHIVYGVAVVGVLLVAGTFAAEAPPRPRAVVMGAAGLTALALAWRLLETG